MKRVTIGVLLVALLAVCLMGISTPAQAQETLTVDCIPFLFVYPGADTSLPEALTTIGPDGANIVTIIWGVKDTNQDGLKKWISYDPKSGGGFLGDYGLENGEPYLITHTDGLGTEWQIGLQQN